MKIKIAYIELDTHAEIADAFYSIAQKSELFSVDFLFSPKIQQRIPHIPSTLVESPKAIFSILKNNHYQHIIIGTAHRYFHIWNKIVSHYPTSIIVHNQNFTRLNSFQLLTKIFKEDWKYRLKLLLKENLLSAPKIHSLAKRKWVLDRGLERKDFSYLPIFCTNEKSKIEKNLKNRKHENEEDEEKNIIVIPGAVQQTRRDYGKILDALKYFTHPTEVVLLGKAEGSELQGILSTLPFLPKHIDLKYFTEKIPKEIFDDYLSKATVLWCPIQEKTSFFSNEEYYGKTKMSGNILDAIRSEKPIIIPQHHPCTHNFMFHEKENIETQILSLQQKQFDFSEFTIERKVKDWEQAIMGLVNTSSKR
ncbi:hypothetical protein [Bergeyella zoohelcum]|uniref:hypothetical protein n=1 Tax=Bergeyella zoohelcum TaxID=1015 RepID=UPI003736B5A6